MRLLFGGFRTCHRKCDVRPSGKERLNLRIAGSGRWQADLVLTGLPPEVSGPLMQGGFTARPGGIGIGTSGQF